MNKQVHIGQDHGASGRSSEAALLSGAASSSITCGSSTVPATSQRALDIGHKGPYALCHCNLDKNPGPQSKQQLTIVAVHDSLWTMLYAPPAELPIETKVAPIT